MIKHLRRHRRILAMAGVGVVALAVGFGIGKVAGQRPEDALASCGATTRLLDTYFYGLEDVLVEADQGDGVFDYRHSIGHGAVRQAIELSECEVSDLIDAMDLDAMSEMNRHLVMTQLASLSLNHDIPNLPAEAAEMAAAIPRSGGRPDPVFADIGAGEQLILFTSEECECYGELIEAVRARQADTPILVVDEGPVGWELSERYGAELLDPEKVFFDRVPDMRPLAFLVRNEIVVAAVAGVGGFSDPRELWSELGTGIDRSGEPVPEEWVFGAGGCDGHEAAGVAINGTDRPILAVVGTNPAVEFDSDGLILPNLRWHVVGVLEPFEHAFWAVETGIDAKAPCELRMVGYYQDGEWLGTEYTPGDPPADFTWVPTELVDVALLPQPVVPEGAYPSPADVTPLED